MTIDTTDRFAPPPMTDLESFEKQYTQRFYNRICTNLLFTQPTVGHNGIKLLLCLRQRSDLLYRDLLASLSEKLVGASYLLARAHVEVSGTCGCLLYFLRRYYEDSLTFTEIDTKLMQLSLGGMSFPDRESRPNAPKPIRVGKQIEKADKVLSENGKAPGLREIYGFLSEYCHPNMLGAHLGVHMTDSPLGLQFEKRIQFKPVDLNTVVNGACISCICFLSAFDDTLALLTENEEIPILER